VLDLLGMVGPLGLVALEQLSFSVSEEADAASDEMKNKKAVLVQVRVLSPISPPIEVEYDEETFCVICRDTGKHNGFVLPMILFESGLANCACGDHVADFVVVVCPHRMYVSCIGVPRSDFFLPSRSLPE
jgi:hypothetical protein